MMKIRDVSKHFTVKKGSSLSRTRQIVRAVQNVTLDWDLGDFVAIVGESGCGKSTLGRMLAGITPPTSGTITLDGEILGGARGGAQRKAFARMAQLIPQDPYAALNPVRRIKDLFYDPLSYHKMVPRGQIQERVEELLTMVGLNPANVMNKYPNQLSGGQRQRVVVARALTVDPKFLIADESVSMVDVSLRIGIMDNMKAISRQRQLGLMFITHDFRVARYIAQGGRIAVMYLGQIIEQGPTEEVLKQPMHPYTQALISAVPILEGREERVSEVLPKSYELTGVVPHEGCPFEPRCPLATDICVKQAPELEADPVIAEHLVACHFSTPREMVRDLRVTSA